MLLTNWTAEEVKKLRLKLKAKTYSRLLPNGKALEIPIFCKVLFDKKRGTISVYETQDSFSEECLQAIFDVVADCGGFVEQRSAMFLTGIYKKK